jgi:hypothetical protein
MLEGALDGGTCRGETVPAAITTKLARAEGLIDRAANSPPKKAKRLLKQAKVLLRGAAKAAGKAAKRKKPKLSTGCAATIQQATDGVRSGLGV